MEGLSKQLVSINAFHQGLVTNTSLDVSEHANSEIMTR